MKKVRCLKPGCDRTWPRDPALEVACPTCQAKIGQICKRPSGHRNWNGEPHAARDLAADAAGKYGPCPLGLCGAERKAWAMSREDLARLGGEIYGPGWQSRLARDLGLTVRQVQRYAGGQSAIPSDLGRRLVAALEAKRKRLVDLLAELMA